MTGAEFAAAAAKAGPIGAGHLVTFGTSIAEYEQAAPAIEALIATPGTVRRLDLARAPRLRLIQSTAAGVDALAPFDMIPDGVMLLNNRGVHADRAGEFAIMAMLMLAAHMPEFATDQRAHRWNRRSSGIIAGLRATIVGVGGLGGGAARRARQFDIRVTGIRNAAAAHPDCDRTLTVADLDKVLPETDFLLLACPLTEATRNLIDARRLALLPARAGVINIGRGELLVQAALIAALRNGTIAGAVLDVFTEEPVPAEDPIWDAPNLIMTPHISSDDPERYNEATLAMFFENLRALAEGRTPRTLVDLAKGY
ncbi:D-2-hydroxyacid dehydrogenase [Acidiphilium iwatense]|uniref:D-2-hydroxyacid dehydrogenase n=1 Tax=Acidiphilium iwatense TaxID=768198 RepID=UPI001F248A0C|nr:D-2-hydroxyacid dehydrogenase [Acidiphilium iwatense]